jgi:ABC-type Zn uptake system ZnuABC Zn-binding protein ZnuA
VSKVSELSKVRSCAAVVAAALLALGLAACGTSDEAATGPADENCVVGSAITGRAPRIVATVAPITSLVAQVVGAVGASVVGLVPEGTNSHTFEPPPSAAAVLEQADVVFMNGLVLEEPTKDLAHANMREESIFCELGTAILPEAEWLYDFSFPKEGGKPNPHLWTNPPMAKQYAAVVLDVLSQLDPTNADTYKNNFDVLAQQIGELDAAMAEATLTIPAGARLLLTYHDAYAYFAKHYGWTVVGAIQPSSFDEPTPKDVVDLIAQVREQQVRAIFGSEVFPSSILEQIGAETGTRYIDVLRDDDLPGAAGDELHSWQGLMHFNFITMVEALGGDATALRTLNMKLLVVDSARYTQ